MEGLNSFIISFCGSCVLLGFLYMLCPSGSMSASVKYVFCLCFVCCIVGAAVTLPSPDFSYFDAVQGGEILTEQNTAVTAETVFSEALRQQNINFRKIAVDTNKTDDGSIIISKVTVYTDEQPQKIYAVIDSDGYEVEVINE